MNEFDLIVVGGGPAGLSSAITASRAGARTLLLERSQLPRHRVCGEFVSAESLTLLNSLLFPDFTSVIETAPKIESARLFVDESILETAIDPPAASIARFELDSALWQAALRADVDARQQITVKHITGGGPFEVSTTEGNFHARSVVDASGRWSNLRSTLPQNLPSRSEKWIGLKAHFFESTPATSVDLYFFRGGYCGVQPVGNPPLNDGRALVNACAMVRTEVATTLPQVLRCHRALLRRSQGWQQAFETVATSPLIFSAPRPVRENILIAGDAVAFVDPFVGDGISLALRSGALAAESMGPFLAGQSSLPEVLKIYEERYRLGLAPIFRVSSKIRRLFALPRPVRKGLLRVFDKAPGLTRYVVQKTR